MSQLRELLIIVAFYLAGASLISAGALLLFGLGVCLIVIGGFAIIAAALLSRGIARVPTG